VLAAAGLGYGDLEILIHGTTLATNALIERRGAKVAFVTTEGFRDVIEMRTESRFDQYDLNLVLPVPLVPREDRFPVAGRIGAQGQELAPLDEAALEALADRIAAGGYGAVAIGFIHSYMNPAHERARARSSRRRSICRSRSRPKSRRRCASSSGSTPSAPMPMCARRWQDYLDRLQTRLARRPGRAIARSS
jgi:N-methylhydantoinase A